MRSWVSLLLRELRESHTPGCRQTLERTRSGESSDGQVKAIAVFNDGNELERALFATAGAQRRDRRDADFGVDIAKRRTEQRVLRIAERLRSTMRLL